MTITVRFAKLKGAMRAGSLVVFLLWALACPAGADGPIIVDHHCIDIRQIPESAIEQAKAQLHIAYGHTSHGSQLISGMGSDNGASFDQFMTDNGADPGLYLWNNGGSGGALDLHDNFVPGDLGNPDRTTWAQRTRDYLDNPANADVNVVIWSWCGQADTSIANIDIYLNLMEGLISDYPDVAFVFMTGHLNGTGPSGQLSLANDHIRNHCLANNRILYDFADIESYDPDGLVNYHQLNADDGCYYDSDGNGSRESNWALDWQAAHVEGLDWWASGAAHSQHLNGNLKGYAAWWLWASLAGWNQTVCIPGPSALTAALNPSQDAIVLSWTDNSDTPNETGFIIRRRAGSGAWDNDYARVSQDITQYTDTNVLSGTYDYRVVAWLDAGNGDQPCSSAASNTASVSITTQAPADPSSLGASLSGSGISLTWTDNSDNEDGFILERSVDGGDFAELVLLGAGATSHTDLSVAGLHTYTYRVKAYNSSGDSAYSNEAGQYMPVQTQTLTLKQGVDGYQGCMDAFLDQGEPGTNFGATMYTYIGGIPEVRTAFRFELPATLADKVIHQATLTLYCWSVSGYVEGNQFDLHEITESWDEMDVTWLDRESGLSWSVPGGGFCSMPAASVPIQPQGFYPGFDITALVQKWVNQPNENNGVILINDTATRTGIKASEYSEYGRPFLEISYSNEAGCTPDKDDDADVDGMDLCLFAAQFSSHCLESLAELFGTE